MKKVGSGWRRGLLFLVLVPLLAGACGRAGSETNEIGLIYSGGITEDKVFKGILQPGSTWNSVGWGSKVYRYRIDQRSWIAGKGKVADTEPVIIVSEDDVQMAVEYQLYFKLNQDTKVIRQFHENLGVKTGAWKNDGWIEMLDTYFGPQIERALEAAALKHKWRDLYASEEARVALQTTTVEQVKGNIREVIGADYFCGPAYTGPGSECGIFTMTVGKPFPTREDIIAAIESEQTAAAKTIAQEQENQRIAKELESERTLVELYGPQGALLREAIKGGKVQQFIIDQTGRNSANAPQPR